METKKQNNTPLMNIVNIHYGKALKSEGRKMVFMLFMDQVAVLDIIMNV